MRTALPVLCLLFSIASVHASVPFLRGDADQSGHLNLTDSVQVLRYLFLGSPAPACLDSADATDDGALNLTDPIYLLNYLFLGGGAPPAPHRQCGVDPTEDQLGCASYSAPECVQLPRLVSVRAVSNHFVAVEFDAPLTEASLEALLDKGAYLILGPDGSPLEVLEVRYDANDARRVLVATASQQVIPYTLTVSGVEGPNAAGDGGGGAPGGSIVFQGSDDAEPRPVSAISLGSTETEGRILLTYSEPMDEGLLDTRFYVISDPDLEIRRIELSTVGVLRTTVVLVTESQRNLLYSLKITNVKSSAGAFVVDPTRNVVTFQGVPAVDTTPPRVLRAEPTGNTTIVLSFSEPLAPGSEDPRNFVIRCFDPFTNTACANLAIQDTELTALGTQIVLTTLPQEPGMTYTVEILNRCGSLPDRDNCVKDIQENPISPTGNTATFTGLDRDRPYLASAISLGPDATDPTRAYVLLTFSEPVLEGAETIAFYSITHPDLDIFAARLSLDGLTVTLTTSPQDPVQYTVRATNIVSRAGGYALDPTRSSAPFVGIPPVDTILPRVTAAVSTSLTSVAVAFSEPILPGAADALNFRITCRDPVTNSACADLVVTGATLTNFGTQVSLNTLLQTANVEYTVTVLDRCTEAKDACVKDLQGNRIDPTANSARFVFNGNPFLSSLLPRVVGAVSTSNTTVVVTFSKPMDRSVENAANYIIVQMNVNPEVGYLVVLSAHFLDADHTSVELTTLSQNEVTYSVTAVNVRDLAGNQMEPPPVVAGLGLLSAATALFPGTPPTEDQIVDTDSDGLADNVEQRGWIVTIKLQDGSFVQRQVTSSPYSSDSDDDGLDDATELRLASDPRSADTDGDQLDDNLEFNIVYTSLTNQDTDGDGLDDWLEVEFFKTNAILADSDGDGFTDGQELLERNRDPRIADLPRPEIGVSSINLQLQEQFTFTDEEGVQRTENTETKTSVSDERERKTSFKVGAGIEIGLNQEIESGLEQGMPTVKSKTRGIEFKGSINFEFGFESSQKLTEAFEQSMSKGFQVTGTHSTSRAVVGARIDAFVDLGTLGDVAFSIQNLEITVSTPDPVDRTNLIPVATLVPNSTLVTGNPAVYNIGPSSPVRGPILFSSRDVFPTLVEDLLRDPRGLVFEIANYDIIDEFGRNFAFASQIARDRTIGIVMDFGEGAVEPVLVSNAPVRSASGEIVGGFATFPGIGPLPALPLSYILEEILQLPKTEVSVGPIWLGQPPVYTADPDGILAGPNGVSDSVAQGDDVQAVPAGIDGLPEDTVIVTAGEDGVLDTRIRGDDVGILITGYSTTRTCGPDTPSSIRAGRNGRVDTLRDPASDDEQPIVKDTSGVASDVDVITAGANGFIDTAAAGDDVYVGPGVPCDEDNDCPGEVAGEPGACDGQEILFRLKHRERGQFARIWAVLLPDSSQLGVDFTRIQLRPGELVSLAFIQDRDRDGLISEVESLFGASDTRQDTDRDGLDDFSEIKVGWEVGVAGGRLRRVFPDPRQADSDRDGLLDREEQDIRRVQCECVGGDDPGEACTRNSPTGSTEAVRESCRGGEGCKNIADPNVDGSFNDCSIDVTLNRTDPRRRDTDSDLVLDAEEVMGFQTGAGIVDPRNMLLAGADRVAQSTACAQNRCDGGQNDGQPCRFDRDCPTLRQCDRGIKQGVKCTNDIDCQGNTPADSGLCEEAVTVLDYEGTCERPAADGEEACDDVQVVKVGTAGLHSNTVVVAPGRDGVLHSTTVIHGSDAFIGESIGFGPGQHDLRAATSALGDDQQIALVDPARILEDTPLGRTIIRPGINGVVNSVPALGDALARGQRLQTTDPLFPDTDDDQIGDGFERILGSDPRDPVDGGNLGDTDGDGLTDGQETFTGWIVRVVGQSDRTVYSNPNAGDSDLDGVPDYVEYALRIDPTIEDTDGDGLTDYDELSAEQFEEFARLNSFFPGFFIDGSASKQYGTDPRSCDSDSDRLPDAFEILVGWTVTTRGQAGVSVRRVFSDPTNADTDYDGLGDGAEYRHTYAGVLQSTDPGEADSDDDSTTDGEECATALAPPADTCSAPAASLATCGSNPLSADKQVTIRVVNLSLLKAHHSVRDNLEVDLIWDFHAQHSSDPFPGTDLLSVTDTTCPAGSAYIRDCGTCGVRPGIDVQFGTDNEVTLAVRPGEGVLISGQINDVHGCNSTYCMGGPRDPSNYVPPPDTDPDDIEPEDRLTPCNGDNFERTCECPFACVNGLRPGSVCNPDNAVIDECGCPVITIDLGGGNIIEVPDCTGVACEDQCEENDIECGLSPRLHSHVSYARAFSYDTLQKGFTAEITRLNNAADGNNLEVELIVEILVR